LQAPRLGGAAEYGTSITRRHVFFNGTPRASETTIVRIVTAKTVTLNPN